MDPPRLPVLSITFCIGNPDDVCDVVMERDMDRDGVDERVRVELLDAIWLPVPVDVAD